MRTTCLPIWALGLGLGLGPGSLAWAQAPSPSPAIQTPAPVSGRSLARPETINAADAYARLLLVKDQLELIRQHMGRYAPAPPLVRVKNVSLDEVYFAALSIRRRIMQLAYEQLRAERDFSPPPLPEGVAKPIDVFRQLDGGLERVLQVKASLGIETSVAERVQPDDVDATVLFNGILEVAALVNVVLDQQTRAIDAFRILTIAVHVAMRLHFEKSKKMMPDEPDFVPAKMPVDVFQQLVLCFRLLAEIAATVDVSVLQAERIESEGRKVTPDDVFDFVVVMLAEMDRVSRKLGISREIAPAFLPERKFPSHVYQRAVLLERILQDVAAGLRPQEP